MRLHPYRGAASLLAAFVLLLSSCAQLTDLPTLTEDDLDQIKLAQSSKLYDGSGKLMTTLHGIENRTSIPIGKIPQHVQDAVIAIEDERFYEHEGVDVRAILRALISNVSSGDIREGGSTITQQYVKNTLIAPGETADRTIERKINEASLARQLEKKISKEQILERYLNTVYFGQGAYGIQAAAKTYFGRPARKLTTAQAATLAGIIRSPESYDPFDRKKAAVTRRNVVIDKMEELGFIDAAEALKARGQKMKLQPKVNSQRYPAPYFVDYVRRLIKYDPRFKAVGKTPEQREQQMFQGGLRIYTTVDLEDQAAADAAVASVLPYRSDPHASLVAIEPSTGHIKAMVGGRDYFAPRKKDRFAKLNLATVIEPNLDCARNRKGDCKTPYKPAPAPGAGRQAGSAFKPFALVSALEQGVPLSKVFKASGSNVVIPGADNGADYTVQNYEGSSYGPMTLLEATVKSVNVVYALLGQEIGVQNVVDTADEMGINTPLSAVASAPLGTNAINPLGMASGYGTLATNGIHHPPVAITRITDASGKVIYRDRSEGEQVVDPGAAYLATTALEQVIQRGTAAAYGGIGRPAAGKTGTAQEYRDAWFVGYTPDLVASVWVGYPEGQIEMKPSCSVTFSGSREVCRPTRIQVTGGSWPTQIWQAFMLRALSDVAASAFTKPAASDIVTVAVDSRDYSCLAGRFTPAEFRVSAQFAAGTEPTKTCKLKRPGTKVPDVFGFPVDDATRVLTDAGFTVAEFDEESSTYPPGRVIGQAPEGGATAAYGSTIAIYVSVKPSKTDSRTRVPDLLGLSRSEAEARIFDAGLEAKVITERESDGDQAKKRRGRVWKQSPGSGSRVERGSTVTIWVNPG